MRKALKAYSHWSRLHRHAKISAEKQAIAIEQWPVFRLITDLGFCIIKANTCFLKTFNLAKDNLPSLGQLFTGNRSDPSVKSCNTEALLTDNQSVTDQFHQNCMEGLNHCH